MSADVSLPALKIIVSEQFRKNFDANGVIFFTFGNILESSINSNLPF
jgi:hypothetical protein